jgi:CheY-like chemotaxis protein
VDKGLPEFSQLILLGVAMPVLDGWEFLIEQNGDLRLAEIAVVIMSRSKAHADRAKEAVAVAFLPKPFDPRDLLPAINQFMRAA